MKMYQVDAFSETLFKGNPAAVIVRDEWLSNDLMQQIASENNLSETAFVKLIDNQNYEIRWFTPKVEVDFCGHATLASAFILFKAFGASSCINFHVKNMGIFQVRQQQDGRISMRFPQRQVEKLSDYPNILDDIIDTQIHAVYLNQQAYIIELQNGLTVENLKINPQKLYDLNVYAKQRLGGQRGLALTAKGQMCDCVSRYFSPNIGMAEDPVTGSIHTAIVPLWAKKLNKTEIIAYQASQRGGALYCKILDDEHIEISGYAKLYMQADLAINVL